MGSFCDLVQSLVTPWSCCTLVGAPGLAGAVKVGSNNRDPSCWAKQRAALSLHVSAYFVILSCRIIIRVTFWNDAGTFPVDAALLLFCVRNSPLEQVDIYIQSEYRCLAKCVRLFPASRLLLCARLFHPTPISLHTIFPSLSLSPFIHSFGQNCATCWPQWALLHSLLCLPACSSSLLVVVCV